MKSLKIILALAFLASATFLKAQVLPVSTPIMYTTCMDNTQDCGFQMCITHNYSHPQVSSDNSCFLVEVFSEGSTGVFIASTNGYDWDFEADNYVNAVVCFGPDFGDNRLRQQIFCGRNDDNGNQICRDGCIVDIGDGG